VHPAAVTRHQFFKSVQIAGLHSGHQISVRVNLCPFLGTLFGKSNEDIFEAIHVPWLNVGGGPEAHLECVQEVVECRYGYGLQNVLFGKAVATKVSDILAAETGRSGCKFEHEVQKCLGL